MRVGMKSSLSLGIILLALVGFAEVEVFPHAPWEKLCLERSATEIRVNDARGRWVATLRGEPHGASVTDVSVALTPEGLSIAAGKALGSSLSKVVLRTAPLAHRQLVGRRCSLETKLSGPKGSSAKAYFEGRGPQGHFYRLAEIMPRGGVRAYPLEAEMPAHLDELHLRLDIVGQPIGRPIVLQSFRYAPVDELPLQFRKIARAPRLLFRADFDGTADATFAEGQARPLRACNLGFEPGVDGQAVRVTRRALSQLEYAAKGNVDPVRGSVAMWVRREWNFKEDRQPWRTLFAFPWTGGASGDRIGTGAVWFWFAGTTLRADPSDYDDSYRTCGIQANNAWVHLVCTWDEEGVGIFVNGKRLAGRGDGASPMEDALRAADMLSVARPEFSAFSVGSRNASEQADALIDDFRIYSAPLGSDEVKAIWQEHAPQVQKTRPQTDYARIFANEMTNVYEGVSCGVGGVPGELDLVEEVKLDNTFLRRLGEDRVRTVGEFSFGHLADTQYLELGSKEGSRIAIRFDIDTNAPLYCFEFDLPDNAKRTADLIVQPCKGEDYILQVGVAMGDEYPNSNRILTHRCLYWSHAPDVAAVLMTAREGSPAALSAIRLYRVKDGRLPVAAVREPKPNLDGWRRSFAMYFEDPAVGLDFGLDQKSVGSATGIGRLIDRVAAKMKYTGENIFAYPGVWYKGLIDDDWNPRGHAPDFLLAWYEKFGREGLGVVPTVNPNTMPVPSGLVTLESMGNGALHPTVVAIHDTGKPNWGKRHNTPPNFNFHHPQVQAHIEHFIDVLLEQGKEFPAFRGICLHMTRHCMLWFGDEASGYNDYTVRAFAADCGVAVPFDRFAANPLRGKDYALWLREHCWEEWIQWRCDQVTKFYVRMAKKLSAARPDLKLWVNSFVPPDVTHPDFTRNDFLQRANRRCGLDGAALTQGASNLILCQTLLPADYRWRRRQSYPSEAAAMHQRVLDTLPGTYSLLHGADYPWVNLHDRYWESAIGRLGGSRLGGKLTCDWMKECPWRVTVVNPAGRHALRPFALPFRYSDVLGLSKGGFLVGTYGMEDVLVPFVQAFRALPAVIMDEIGRVGDVVVRQRMFDGKSYFYVVNTSDLSQSLDLVFPQGSVDLVSGERLNGGQSLNLKAYEFRSFSAPSGKPMKMCLR